MSEFEEAFGDWLTYGLIVERWDGAGFDGPAFAAPVTIVGPVVGVMVEQTRRLIRNSDGNEVVSETTIYVPPEREGAFNLHARVTLLDGTVSKVLRIAKLDVFGLPSHQVVNLE